MCVYIRIDVFYSSVVERCTTHVVSILRAPHHPPHCFSTAVAEAGLQRQVLCALRRRRLGRDGDGNRNRRRGRRREEMGEQTAPEAGGP